MASASLDLNDPNGQLPRIAVISDVAVERTGAGSLLLYRLLKDYPSDQLKIFYNPDQASSGDVRLPAAQYYPLRYRFSKAIRNRFNPFWPIAGAYQMQQRAADVLRCLGTFEPEAVVSVAHGFLWFTADAVARKLGVPLHLFLHEDWPQLVTQNQPGRVKDSVRAVARMRIKRIFRGPGARFSVSPGMAEELLERYGLKTEVVYPNRGDDSPTAVVRVAAQASRAPTVAHAGFIHFAGNAALLRALAGILGPLGGHLDLYTTHAEADLARFGLLPPVVRRIGFFPAKEFAERAGATAHALFLTALFQAQDRAHESTLFPSKLADYTAIGLPILVWGPAYSSAARWASANPGAASLLTGEDSQPVRDAVTKVSANTTYARTLADGAVEAGQTIFAFARA